MTDKNPLQHHKVGRIRHWYHMWQFNNKALAVQRRREDEINSLIKIGRKAAKKSAKQTQ
jgi:hypothetical protein